MSDGIGVTLTGRVVVCEGSSANLFCGKIKTSFLFCIYDGQWMSYIEITCTSFFFSNSSVSGKGQVIFVLRADFGRHDQTTCSYKRTAAQLKNVECSGPTSKVADRYSCSAFPKYSIIICFDNRYENSSPAKHICSSAFTAVMGETAVLSVLATKRLETDVEALTSTWTWLTCVNLSHSVPGRNL